MPRFFALFAIASLVTLSFNAQPPSNKVAVKPAVDPLQGLSCSRFEWNDEKNVMRVPLSLDGKDYWYQLDTGADVVITYGNKTHEGWTPAEDGMRIPRVRFAGLSLPAILSYPMKNISDEGLKGTVGLDLLVGRTFVIDFPKQRICLMERAGLPNSLAQAADWADAEIRHGKLFVTMTLNRKELDGIFYDTGSSPSTLDVDLGLWQEATGKSGTDDAASHSKGQSWGQQIEGIAASSTGNLTIGKHVYPTPPISTIPGKPNRYHTDFHAQGLLGNALFLNSIIIFDLGAHPRLGIVDK